MRGLCWLLILIVWVTLFSSMRADSQRELSIDADDIEVTDLTKPDEGVVGGSTQAIIVQTGDSLTTIARVTIADFLLANEDRLSDPQLIYAEDYVATSMGSFQVDVSQQVQLDLNLVDEAISAAKNLTQDQITNLEPWAELVNF